MKLLIIRHGDPDYSISVTTLITEERVKGTVFFRCMQMGDTSHLYAAGEPISRAGLYPECCEK